MTKALVVIKGSKQAKAHLGKLEARIKDQEGDVELTYAHDEYDYVSVVDKPKDKSLDWQQMYGKMIQKYKSKVESINFDTGSFGDGLVEAADLALYQFNKYKSEPNLNKLTEILYGGKAVGTYGIGASVNFARDLVSEPGNVLYPEEYAHRIMENMPDGMTVKVYGQRQLEKMGFNLLLSVGQGSEKDSHVVVMEWMNGKSEDPVTALVGKGVTFDTGGISLKPSKGMGDMKYDMGGSAAVVGAMHAIGSQNLKKNVVGIVGLVENMPSGSAIKPGDVVTSLSGMTVENLNTDAEGRLVLADLLTHVQREYDPNTVVELSTLTGAIQVALGNEMAGMFTNSTELAERITDAGNGRDEKFYRMPMGKVFNDMIDSDIADMKNISNGGPGSTTAAEFLYRFVDNKRAFAHLDIAGKAWENHGKPLTPKGAAGFGVRTLHDLVRFSSNKDLAVDEDMDY